MAKKMILVSPALVCAAVIMAVVLSGIGGAGQEATPAELEQAKVEIRALLKSGEYEQAQSSIESLRVQFSDDPGLAKTLYDIGQEYRWVYKYNEAKGIFEEIVQNYVDSSAAKQAELGLARLDVLSSIKYYISDLEAAQSMQKVDALVGRFSSSPDLVESLYWIAKEYEWKMLLPQSKATYQHIIDSCSNSSYVSKARIGVARVNTGALVEAGDLAAADAAYKKMIADFEGNEDLPWTLYWLTKRYEGPNEFEKAKSIYRYIIEKWPDSKYAEQSRIDIPAADVFALIVAKRHDEALAALDKLIADFQGSSYLALVVRRTPQEYYYEKGIQLKDDGFKAEAEEYFSRAITMFERSINQFEPSINRAFAYYCSAACYSYLEDYKSAATCYENVVKGWPDFMYACSSYWLLAESYGMLSHNGLLPEPEAKQLIHKAYQAIVDGYPDCSYAGSAREALEKIGI